MTFFPQLIQLFSEDANYNQEPKCHANLVSWQLGVTRAALDNNWTTEVRNIPAGRQTGRKCDYGDVKGGDICISFVLFSGAQWKWFIVDITMTLSLPTLVELKPDTQTNKQTKKLQYEIAMNMLFIVQHSGSSSNQRVPRASHWALNRPLMPRHLRKHLYSSFRQQDRMGEYGNIVKGLRLKSAIKMQPFTIYTSCSSLARHMEDCSAHKYNFNVVH